MSTTDPSLFEVPELVTDEDGVTDVNETAEAVPYNFEITAYGADYPVDGLIGRLDRGDIVIPTFDPAVVTADIMGFQRRFVWRKQQADRFVDSLLLGLPVPGVFFVLQQDGRFLVLDGQQRLRTLQGFYKNEWYAKEFRLEAVQEQFKGLRYQDLNDEDRRRLDNSIIHATVIRQDKPSENQSSVYMIFERLNSGGTNLQPQEIRVALYAGEFAHVLQQLNENDDWRAIFGKRSERLKDQELILRFFAFLYAGGEYRAPMKEFLNNYMARNRNLGEHDEAELSETFKATTRVVREALGQRTFRIGGSLNAAILDSAMTALASRLQRGPIKNLTQVADTYDALLNDDAYRQAVEQATANEQTVQQRLQRARDAFDAVK